MHWCFHCYAVNPRGDGPCVRCGRSVQGPADLSYDERLTWTLGHPDGDRAILAAQILGQRRARGALPALQRLVDDAPDPFLAVAALRSAVAIANREELRDWLKSLTTRDSFMVAAVASQALDPPG